MRNVGVMLFLLTSLAASSQEKKEVALKIRNRPETTVRQLMSADSRSVTTISGSAELVEMLTANGHENPQTKSSSMAIESVVATGKVKNGVYPISITFARLTGDAPPIPAGTVIYGHAETDKMPVFDSIVSDALDDGYKADLLKGMTSMFSQVRIPERTIKLKKQ